MKEFRCSKCGKLLGKIEGKAEIKCTRCSTTNIFYDDRVVGAINSNGSGWVDPKCLVKE